MYRQLGLKNFKAFRELDLELRPLTMLSGMNGMGKSSVLQSLLLLRQSYLPISTLQAENRQLNLILNGDLVQLGTGQDVFFDRVDYVPDSTELKLSLTDDHAGEHSWVYEYDSATADVLLPVAGLQPDTEIYRSGLFTDDFHYLQAERVGPRTAFAMSDYSVRQRRQLGKAGEFTSHFLQQWRSLDVHDAVRHPTTNSSQLIDQVTAWLGEISPGTQLDIQPHQDMDLISLRVGFPGTKSFRATNVGFGISYTLPVLVALLSANRGYVVLLENPEAHLHPRGQSKMGELIARATLTGAQVIVETHSDHIMNGIRVAARRSIIEPENVAFHFFQRSLASGDVEIHMPELDNEGRLDFWPEHFFDEWKANLDRLLYGGE